MRNFLVRSAVCLISMLIGGHSIAVAEDGAWRVSKASGEAWIGSESAQPVSVSQTPTLRPGDTVRTGRNGRVLLVRGAESILVSPNSAISLPVAASAGTTRILQQAGSILLDVEKRNVQHFEVETPYLAAVVKGTQFRVSLERGNARVNVLRGQVQVADFRSGQFALIQPGQAAHASAFGAARLQITGRGALPPIQQGAPQAPRVAPLPVPGGGLGPLPNAVPLTRETTTANVQAAPVTLPPRGGAPRISVPIGEMNLDIGRVTRGMARSETRAAQGASRATVWSTGVLNPGVGSSRGNSSNSGAAKGTAEANAGSAGTISAVNNAGSQAGPVAASSLLDAGRLGNGHGRGSANIGADGAGNYKNAGGNNNGWGSGNPNAGRGNNNAGGNGNGGGNGNPNVGPGNNNAGGNGNGGGNRNPNAGPGNNNAGGNGNGGGNGNPNAGPGNNNAGGNGNGLGLGLGRGVRN